MRKGYIGAEYEEAGIRAVKAVLANIDATGELKNVSFGTPVFNDLDGYRKIPLTSMPYGQAMAILALGEFKRAFANNRAAGPCSTQGPLRALPRLWKQRLPGRRRDVDHRLLDPVLLHDVLRPHRRRKPAIIFVTARLLDAFFSPVIGYISDRFHRTWLGKRFGRRRFFILLAIPLVPSFALMWVEGQSFWYYLITYCFFELVYAMEIIPYETLAAEMSPDYKTKAKFAGARILCGQIANIAAMWLPGVIIAQLGGKESGDTFLYLGVIFSVFFVFVALAVYLFTWERPREEIASIAPRDRAVAVPRDQRSCSRTCGRRCASARSACISACTSAATSARTS